LLEFANAKRGTSLGDAAMGVLLIIVAIADYALALLLVAVSGFILEGVNNTGPMMPEAYFFVALIVAAVVAPTFALLMRRRLAPRTALAIAAAPLICAAAALLVKPS